MGFRGMKVYIYPEFAGEDEGDGGVMQGAEA